MSAQLDQLTAAGRQRSGYARNQGVARRARSSASRMKAPDRAHYLMERMVDLARRRGAHDPVLQQHRLRQHHPRPPRNNTAPATWSTKSACARGCAGTRWRWWSRPTAPMATSAATSPRFASLANMLGIGFNHFWHAPTADHGGDLLYIQGHSSPGIYARAYLEGRISEEQLLNFRREVDGKGLSSYPHPKLMPTFWQFPTVSMGLGPLMAIYQARFLKYLHARGDRRHLQPQGLGILRRWRDGRAGIDGRDRHGRARSRLDNLVMVVNCNLQRLDGPVRGNGKIIQELEADFRGAGWNVVKVVWGPGWDSLAGQGQGWHPAARDDGNRRRRIPELQGQGWRLRAQELLRQASGSCSKMVANMTDDDIWRLTRGGHDPHKIYAAFKIAQENKGTPTVLLVKTVKGFGMGKSGEARNTAHQTKKLDDEAMREKCATASRIPIPDDKLAEIPFFKPADDAPEMIYLHKRREGAGRLSAAAPSAHAAESLPVPALSAFQNVLDKPPPKAVKSRPRKRYVRIISTLLRDPNARSGASSRSWSTNRAPSAWKACSARSASSTSKGQLYEPVDKDQVMYYREDKAGQILQEGINEAGGMSSWIAAATSYSTNNRIMIPFYTFYSMFGMQRIGDLAWAAGDMRARGFLMGGTAGRTTLNGEGLQHEDGHSHVMAATIPNCLPYDPTFASRSRGDRPGRPAPHGSRAGRRVLLHHPDERELRTARHHPEGTEAGHPEGHVPAAEAGAEGGASSVCS